jgi:hypothetical protein
VIDDRDATEIESIISGDRADFIFVAKHSDPRDALARRFGSRNHRAWIISFGQNDVLRP